jgi:polysaccharide pyruvyl transferase WcaK-like protein
LCHISAFSYGNAGDTLLPVVLRDLFNDSIGIKKWEDSHVYTTVSQKTLRKINSSKGLVIGGGGLFLKDTNPNNLSGWQWSCGIEELRKITVPIVVFAVGYNRFRGQDEFEPIFKEHLNEFVSKASFVGIRNHGSIEKLKSYLDDERLKRKLMFQPCMTTLISKIYPMYADYSVKDDFIALNCAFDRQHLRSNNDTILKSIVMAVKKLSTITKIKYYSHMKSDNEMLPYLDEQNIPYDLIEFQSVKQIVECYSRPRLVIGMRGHAQMIPVGCNTPILSIVSHDKMQWFLNDINHPEWGVDVLNENFGEELMEKALFNYNEWKNCYDTILVEQSKLWRTTSKNLQLINSIFV